MDFAVQIVSIAFLTAITGYFLLQALSFFRNAAIINRNVDLEREVLSARIGQIMDLRQQEKEKNELSWNGYRKFEVTRKVDEGADISSFYLTPHDRKRLPPFLPGQYLTFSISIPDSFKFAGGIRKDIKPVIRCYSLSDSPYQREYYRVTIKKLPPPRDKPGGKPGLASSYFHERVNKGDILDVKAPMGKFTLEAIRPTPVVLVGGGVGLTPVLSMLDAIVDSGSRREVWFFYGVRNRVEHIMKDDLERIARKNDNVRLHVCYSNPEQGDLKGKDYQHAERVSVELFKRLLPSSNYEFYICGPPPMMNQITSDLKAWGVPQTKINFEAFGPATVKKLTPPTKEVADKPKEKKVLQVTFAHSGKSCVWKDGDGSLLELAEKNQVSIDSGCRAGNCGTCLTAIRSGEVDYMVDHGAKPEAKSCLSCIAVPKSNIVLDA